MKKMMIFIALLIMLNACTGGNSRDTDIEKEIYKGTEGIVLDLFQNNLPSEVFEGEQLVLVMKIENRGPYEVKNSRLVAAVEKGVMEFRNGNNIYEKQDIQLDGKNVFITFDDFHIEEAVVNVKEIEPLSEYHDSNILVNFCYDYRSIAFADICIDTDPYDQKTNEKACSQIDSIGMSEGQGGPVVINRIETRMLVLDNTIRPQFKIYISNRGQGTVATPGKVDEVCNRNSIGQGTYNALHLVALEMSGFRLADFDCLPKELVLYRDEDVITCTLNRGIDRSRAPYLTPLKVELSYGYMETASKEIKIKKILKV